MAQILLLFALAAAVATYGLIKLALPLLRDYALARPDHRSSHTVPTPQGGGMFVVAVTVIAAAAAAYLQGDLTALGWVLAATLALAIVGAVDDLRTLQAVPRLVLQTIAIAVVVATLPAELRILDVLPWWLERLGLLVGLLWFVNLTNFMDGLDWMTVAEAVPVAAALAAYGLIGALPREATAVAFALCGALIGFAPFNRPVARLFLGDVGSLPIGLLLGWLLVLLAGHGHVAAAILLALYYIADASLTLLRRLLGGEPIMQAHRSHFYQRATDRGFSVPAIVSRVFLLNLALIALASATMLMPTRLVQVAALAAGCLLVGLLLGQFARGRR